MARSACPAGVRAVWAMLLTVMANASARVSTRRPMAASVADSRCRSDSRLRVVVRMV